MAYPENPLTLQCLDRVVEVLKAVQAGDDYFYTIGKNVKKGLRSYQEAAGHPFDCVYLGSDHQEPEHTPDGLVYRYPTIMVAGFVDEEQGEPITKITKHLADVQKAIEADIASNAAGALGNIIGWGRLGPVVTDEGELALEGTAGFRLEILLCLTGEWGEL